jgi:hypothetical protein
MCKPWPVQRGSCRAHCAAAHLDEAQQEAAGGREAAVLVEGGQEGLDSVGQGATREAVEAAHAVLVLRVQRKEAVQVQVAPKVVQGAP